MRKQNIEKHIHKINSSLTIILGYADMLKKKRNQEWSENISKECLKIQSLLEEIRKELD